MNSTNGIMMSVYWIFVVSHIQTNPSTPLESCVCDAN